MEQVQQARRSKSTEERKSQRSTRNPGKCWQIGTQNLKTGFLSIYIEIHAGSVYCFSQARFGKTSVVCD